MWVCDQNAKAKTKVFAVKLKTNDSGMLASKRERERKKVASANIRCALQRLILFGKFKIWVRGLVLLVRGASGWWWTHISCTSICQMEWNSGNEPNDMFLSIHSYASAISWIVLTCVLCVISSVSECKCEWNIFKINSVEMGEQRNTKKWMGLLFSKWTLSVRTI